MPIVNIDGVVSFATNYGVMVHEKALSVGPEELSAAVRLAYSHLNDPPLVAACCGGSGPLANYHNLDFAQYLELLRESEISEAGATAKKRHTQIRRSEFNARRSDLVLAMLNAGIPHICAEPGCEITDGLTVDHIKALSRGGTDELTNLRFLCLPHNSSKGDRDEA
jgi:HNH endonuclease